MAQAYVVVLKNGTVLRIETEGGLAFSGEYIYIDEKSLRAAVFNREEVAAVGLEGRISYHALN